MSQRVAAGGTITLDAVYRDGTGAAVAPGSPLVDIIDPDGVTLINNAAPTLVSLGRYEYAYPTPAAGPLGVWTARWTGTINGSPVEADDLFTVVVAGDIGFTGDGSDGPCAAWATEADIDDDCLPGDLVAADVVAKLPAAADLLYRESAYQYPGVCTSPVIRPRGGHPDGDDSGPVAVWLGTSWWIPQGIDGTLAVNCLGGGACSCLTMRQILLPGEPVVDIIEVRIDGTVVDPGAYRVDDWRYLVRTDGGTWPACQQAHLDPDQPGTWSVVFRYGTAPPPSGGDAAVALATQFALACADASGECTLPANATRASRRGVEFDLTAADLIDDQGNHTVPEVRSFLHAVNPHQLADDAHVRSPELAVHRSHA